MRSSASDRVRLNGIGGLKFVAIVFMFLWHSRMQRPPVDLGARLCEFFFVVSGFLFYVSNHRKTNDVTVRSVTEYMRKKVVQMWPVHFVGFIAALLLIPVNEWFLPKTLINGLLNLTLIQSWVNNQYVFWGFNGVSWYLSSLLFSYMFGFVFLKLMQNIKHNWGLFAVVFGVRYAFEAIPVHIPGLFWGANIHISPIARSLEFVLGMIAASLFLGIKAARPKQIPFVLSSVLEVSALAGTVLLLVWVEGKWLRAAYAPLFCVLVFCFAFDNGILSRFFSLKPIRWLSGFQLEIYLFHVLVFQWIKYMHPLNIQMLIDRGAGCGYSCIQTYS